MAVGDDEVNIIPASGNMIIDDRLFALGSLERLTGLLHEFRMDPVVAGVAPHVSFDDADGDLFAGHFVPPF